MIYLCGRLCWGCSSQSYLSLTASFVLLEIAILASCSLSVSFSIRDFFPFSTLGQDLSPRHHYSSLDSLYFLIFGCVLLARSFIRCHVPHRREPVQIGTLTSRNALIFFLFSNSCAVGAFTTPAVKHPSTWNSVSSTYLFVSAPSYSLLH